MIRIFTICGFLLWSLSLSAQDAYSLYNVRDVKLEFKQDNWEEILDRMKKIGNDDRLTATLVYNGVRYDSIGVRYKGNSSYFNVRKTKSSKLPFNIKLDYHRKNQSLPGGYESLKLSNVFRDPSFLREVLAYEIAREYMPASQANFVRLYANETLLGVYNSTESVDKIFLRKQFGENKGTLLKCDPTWDGKLLEGCPKGEKASLLYQGEDPICYENNYELKSKKGWKDLVKLAKVLNKSPERIHKFINIDQVLWMHAFNNVIVNLDSYSGRLCHNYYLYQDSFGVFQPIVWDMNLSFGGFRFDGINNGALSNKDMQELSLFLHYKNTNRPLISQLLKDPLNRKIYIAHVRTILNDFFVNGRFDRRIDEIQRTIDYYVKNDANKLYEYEDFKANSTGTTKAGTSSIIGLKELMDARKEHLQSHPLLKKTPPTIKNVVHLNRDSVLLIRANIELATQAYVSFRHTPNGPFTRLPLFDDGIHDDLQAEDGLYAASIPLKELCEYFIIAENEKSAMLSPEKAARKFYQFKSNLRVSQ